MFLTMVRYRMSHQKCSLKNVVPKNYAIFTGKHLCWKLFSRAHMSMNHCTKNEVFHYRFLQ